jgi:hypothetical protein
VDDYCTAGGIEASQPSWPSCGTTVIQIGQIQPLSMKDIVSEERSSCDGVQPDWVARQFSPISVVPKNPLRWWALVAGGTCEA